MSCDLRCGIYDIRSSKLRKFENGKSFESITINENFFSSEISMIKFFLTILNEEVEIIMEFKFPKQFINL